MDLTRGLKHLLSCHVVRKRSSLRLRQSADQLADLKSVRQNLNLARALLSPAPFGSLPLLDAL